MELLYSPCTVSKESGLSMRQLYYWEGLGLIKPKYETYGMRKYRRYSQDDLDSLKLAKNLLDQGYALQSIKGLLLKKDTAETEGEPSPGLKHAAALSGGFQI